MSSFVELAPGEYSPTAFNAFHPSASNFEIGNARALMWLSQLAYESHRKPTIETVSGEWEFSSATGFINQKIDIAGSFETCGLIGERADAVILAFSGTDPGIWENLITDFSLRPADGTDIHGGFHNAAEAARGQVEMAVRLSKEGRKPLFVTGHSLGGALAALAAQMAVASGVAPQAVYVFGMPRTGGEQFKANYNAKLGSVTYRLVYGIDVVSGSRRHHSPGLDTLGVFFSAPVGPSSPPLTSQQLDRMIRRSLTN